MNPIDGEWKNLDFEKVYIYPFGFCMKLNEKMKDLTVYLSSPKKSTVLLVDPYYANTLRLLGRENVLIDLEINEGSSYDVELEMYDSSLTDGQSCSDYEKLETSYGKCLEHSWKNFLLEKLGCLLPWFPHDSQPTCQFVEKTENFKNVSNEIQRFTMGLENKIPDTCKIPCHKMNFKIKKIDDWSMVNTGVLQYNLIDKVTVHKDYYAYDVFDLVVDLGSALGLWLGLSALSIFASFLQCFRTTEKFLNN